MKHARPRRTAWFALGWMVAWMALAVPGVADPELTHTRTHRTKHFEIHVRPGSRAAASAERVGAAAERDFDRICTLLEIPKKGGLDLYLFDDVASLSAITTTVGNGGFSYGTASYVPYDNDQTRFHEMVHIVAFRLPKTGDEPRSLFFADGLANALLEHVHGVHVHAVAAFYRQRDELPTLAEMADGDFYAWQRAHPGFDGYDVAASFLRFLYDEVGAKRIVRYLTGTSARKALGKDRDELEKAWRAYLDGYDLKPEVATLLRQRAGEAIAFEPAATALLRALEGEAGDWTSLSSASLQSDGKGAWRRDGAVIKASNPQAAWAVCELGTKRYGDCVLQATIRTPSPTPIQIRLGPTAQAMLVNGTFLYRDDAPITNRPTPGIGPGRTKTDLMLIRRGPWLQVWVDGELVLTALSTADETLPGLAIFRGSATFEDVRIRALGT